MGDASKYPQALLLWTTTSGPSSRPYSAEALPYSEAGFRFRLLTCSTRRALKLIEVPLLPANLISQRPAAPPLKDRGPRGAKLPRKTATFKRFKKKKRKAKGIKIVEQKRPRNDSPSRETQDAIPQQPRVPFKPLSASSNTRPLPLNPRRRYDAQRDQNQNQYTPYKSARIVAMSAPSAQRYSSPENNNELFRPPTPPTYQGASGKDKGLVIHQRARKTLGFRSPSPAVTPIPPLPDRRELAPALEEITCALVRLDPQTARYSIRSTPLFLSRNLRDGWVERVRVWDKGQELIRGESYAANPNQFEVHKGRLESFIDIATREGRSAMSSITKAPLPRTFCMRLKGFELRDLAKVDLPSTIRVAATLYIANPSSDLLSFRLGSSLLRLPQSSGNFFPTPLRIPPSGNLDALQNFDFSSLWLVRNTGQDEESNISLRALAHPGGIAYVDLLFYDFADESMDLNGLSLSWTAAKATKAIARIEIVGPNAGSNGFASSTQRPQLVWLHSTSLDDPGTKTDYQPRASLEVGIDWGVDSAAPLLRPRVIRPALRPAFQIKNGKLVYRLSVQGGRHSLEMEKPVWACILCNICAPFPTQHVLKVHIRRAHPEVEAKFDRMREDPLTGQDRLNIRLTLPPEVIEVSDDEDVSITHTIAPSTRIGALLSAQNEGMVQVKLEDTGFMPSTPPRAERNLVKQEEPEPNENWSANTMSLLPISRDRSHSPTPALDSPVRPRRDRQPGSSALLQPREPTPAADPFPNGYSSRIHNRSRIYDILRSLPMHHGVLASQVIANEEEMFAEDHVIEGPNSTEISYEETRLMGALWTRWMVVEKNRFIANPFDCLNRFTNSFYLDVVIRFVGYKFFVRFMMEMASRGRIKSREAAMFCKKYRTRERELSAGQ
ncbi:hypothetical protein RhiJN_02193 [Ceratobasidium sp. AG-Ba]|nr:hypothetical protein RhiJN_02193 [Ceratobasidium sp. AG-Ba]QRW03124.1 hypothetical protein RhiLY_02123 [Ceratobasidium sp. AG-Ba]